MDGQRSPGKPFAIEETEVRRAWEKVRADKGAPGADRVSLEELGADLENNLYRIWNRMSSGSDFPPPVRAAEIPKADGGIRVPGVPAIADRVAQTVVAARIEAVAEPVFHDDSCGYRPGRRAGDAVGRCRERCWGYDWVVDLDVAAFFGSVPWDLVIKAVEKHLSLHYAFDARMVREFPDCPFERYADDAVAHCRNQARARQVPAAPRERTGQAGLRLHPDKTRIAYRKDGSRRAPWDGPVSLTFLSCTFRARSLKNRHGRVFTGFTPAASDKATARMSQEITSWHLRRKNALSWKDLTRWLGPVIRGWVSRAESTDTGHNPVPERLPALEMGHRRLVVRARKAR